MLLLLLLRLRLRLFMLVLQLLLSGLMARWSSGPGQHPGSCSNQ
jgi:hypothetical protein